MCGIDRSRSQQIQPHLRFLRSEFAGLHVPVACHGDIGSYAVRSKYRQHNRIIGRSQRERRARVTRLDRTLQQTACGSDVAFRHQFLAASGQKLNPLRIEWLSGAAVVVRGRCQAHCAVGIVRDGPVTLDERHASFGDASAQGAALADFMFTLPGASGVRNPVRGDGTIGLDTGLAKRWKMPWNENHSMQFRCEVFNLPNWNRFDVQSNVPEIDISSSFGNYTGLLTSPRVMQFALRYEF